MRIFSLAAAPCLLAAALLAGCHQQSPGADAPALSNLVDGKYPQRWWEPVPRAGAPAWEIFPDEAQPPEVILSKRNELGLLSNFAATPFTFRGKKYASVEGFWQMMKFPEGPADERAFAQGIKWNYTREQVAALTSFAANRAGKEGEDNMKAMGITWVTFDGEKMEYRSPTPSAHYNLIVAAMREKVSQNEDVKRVLLSTGDLILRPDHKQDEGAPPEWRYFDIMMQIRADLRKEESPATTQN